MTYQNPETNPAIREHRRGNPTTCPWCGKNTWIVSDWDDARDNGRVQMYCDSVGCDARETELIIIRGERAHERADVRALDAIDDGHHAGDAPSPSSISFSDPGAHRSIDRKRDNRIAWRHSDAQFTVEPQADPEDE